MPSLVWLCLLLIVSFHYGVAAVDEFIYNGFAGSNLRLDGAASVTQDGVLTLTTSAYNMQGHAFHPEAVTLVNSNGVGVSFSTTFVFAITPDHYGRPGEGLAFVISVNPDFSTAFPGPYLGLPNPYWYKPPNYNFFAIELDTVKDFEIKDVDGNHVGIDVNSLMSASTSTAGYCINDTDAYAAPRFKN